MMNQNNNLYLISYFLALYLIVAWLYEPMINNGDFWRYFWYAGVSIPSWVKIEDYYLFTSDAQFPISTGGMVAYFWFLVQKAFCLHGYHMQLIFLTFNLLFFYGFWLILKDAKIYIRKVYILIILSFAYIFYGFYFKSLYDEVVILMLLPWIVLSINSLSDNRWKLFLFVSISLFFSKPQMIFFLPILLFALSVKSGLLITSKQKKIISSVLVVVAILSLSQSQSDRNGMTQANNYNRYYNGLGWADIQVYSWPAKEFNGRQNYVYSNLLKKDRLCSLDNIRDTSELFGTSFWPTGSTFAQEAWGQTGSASKQEKYVEIIEKGKLSNFVISLFSSPKRLINYFSNIIMVSLTSDYRLDYLKKFTKHTYALNTVLQSISNIFLHYNGYLFYGFFLMFLILQFSVRNIFLLSYYFIGAPIFVSIGDGFYEFEKHMLPYFILTPVIIYLSIQMIDKSAKSDIIKNMERLK